MMTETVCGFSFDGQDVTCVKVDTGESMNQVEKGPDPFPPEEQVHVEFDPEKQELRMSSRDRTFVRKHNGLMPLTAWRELKA